MGIADLKTVEGDAAKALLAESKFPKTAEYYLGKGAPVLVHDGDLHVDGNLFMPLTRGGPFHLFVRGDLTISGHYADCDDPECSVLVTGSLTADIVVTNGRLEVHGGLVADAVIGDYNDHLCSVGGTMKCRLFIAGEHFFELGRAEVEIGLGGARMECGDGKIVWADDGFDEQHDDAEEEDDTPLYRFYCSLFVPEVVQSEHEEGGLHWDIWLNNARMHGLVREGGPLLVEKR